MCIFIYKCESLQIKCNEIYTTVHKHFFYLFVIDYFFKFVFIYFYIQGNRIQSSCMTLIYRI